MKTSIVSKTVLPALLLTLAACGGNNDSDMQGRMSLAVTDAAVDNATRVVVEFTGVTVMPANGDAVSFDFNEPRQIDLLALNGGESELLLDDVTLDAGDYNWVRLSVNAGRDASDSFIELDDGTTHALFIPSGNQSGLKIVQGFIVPVNATSDFTIDFDLRKSVVDPQNASTEYILKPVLRMVDNTEVGAISGTVDSALATATDCSPAVYVYEGADVTADDVGSGTEPVTSAIVEMNDGTGEFEYAAAFLVPGDYTAAFTCEAANDAPDADDDIAFQGTQNVTVVTGETATADF